MALSITNTFSGGMNLDIPEMLVPKTIYTSALNATLVTSDGNELIMLNDLGNAKIIDSDGNDVTLKAGYIPIGIKDFGGILYIASLNPKDGKCEIGSYPSPNYSYLKGKTEENYSDTEVDLLYKYSAFYNLSLKGYLREFNTEKLNFDIEHEVSIEAIPSYDGSVNLILTDNKNKPMMINTGFAVLENNKCKLIKHIKNNNTNIYKLEYFNDMINLLRLSLSVSTITFNGLTENGQLQVGSYVVYIKASDEDSNTTNVIALSGLIPIFMGSDGEIKSVNGLLGLTRTTKAINLTVNNIDPQYTHLQVYYSIATSNKQETATTTCYKIIELIEIPSDINSSGYKTCLFSITGFENASSVAESEINETYFIFDLARTIATLNNITFVGNVVGKFNNHYEDLLNYSLHIYPYVKREKPLVTSRYEETQVADVEHLGGYSNSKNVYERACYHPGEIYRFGIVYIYSNGTKSSVFDILGVNDILQEKDLIDYCDNIEAKYEDLDQTLYNDKGTCRLPDSDDDFNYSFSMKFYISKNIQEALRQFGIVGYYFVRQKRIPLLLCLAYTTPVYDNAFIPAIRYGVSIPGIYHETEDYDGASIFAHANSCASPKTAFWSSVKYKIKHTYFFESFFLYCGEAYNTILMSDDEDCLSGPKNLFIDFKDQKNNTAAGESRYRYILNQEYRQRLVYTFDKGYVFSRHGLHTENDNPVLGTFVNYKMRDYGKYCIVRGLQPMQSLFEWGAFAGFCPEFECNSEYYSNLFSGGKFTIRVLQSNIELQRNPERVYFTTDSNYTINPEARSSNGLCIITDAKVIAVDDGVGLMGILRDSADYSQDSFLDCWVHRNNVFFSSKIGEATSTTIWKLVGGERVYSFSPIFTIPITTIILNPDLIDVVDLEGTVYSTSPLSMIVRTGLGVKYSNSSYKKDDLDDDDDDLEEAYEDVKEDLDCYSLGFNNLRSPTNLVRGLYGPYLGIYVPKAHNYKNDLGEFTLASSIINIYIPNYDPTNKERMASYMKTVKDSHDAYYAISDRFKISEQTNINCFRGDCYRVAFTHRVNRNFQDASSPSNDVLISENGFMHKRDEEEDGELFYLTCNVYKECGWEGEQDGKDIDEDERDGLYLVDTDSIESSKTNIGDMNAILLGSWISFTVNSTMNLQLRGEDRSYPTEKLQMGLYRSFYPLYGMNIAGSGKIPDSLVYNLGYSVSGGVILDANISNDSYINSYYKNRIYYSNISPTISILNGNRIFKSTNYRDYDTKYGSIVKLISANDNLICVLEHGVTLIPVLPLILLNDGSAGTVYINTTNILQSLWQVISDEFGSMYETSIIKTPYYIYGIDTYANKIWQISLNGYSMQIISDDYIESFLNDHLNIINQNLSIGTRRLKSHYNTNKDDVMFTYYDYDTDKPNNNVLWNICYNEKMASRNAGWVTFYSWIPEFSDNIGNSYISFDHFNTKNIVIKKLSNLKSNFWKHGVTDALIKTGVVLPTKWYDKLLPFELEFMVNESLENYKIFENLEIISNKALPESFHYEIVGETYEWHVDKVNEYYRLEKTKELWHKAELAINIDPLITYDARYTVFTPYHRSLWHYEKDDVASWKDANIANNDYSGLYVKSMVPWNYYIRTHNPNEIENYYYLTTSNSYDYSYLTGTELVYDKQNLDIRYLVHANGIDINGPGGILRGNMKYVKDLWLVQINPLLYKEKNEKEWETPPIIINSNTSLPTFSSDSDKNNAIKEKLLSTGFNTAAKEMNLTKDDFDFTSDGWSDRTSVKLQDKYIRIRIRYSGKEKVLLLAIKTSYSIN